MWWLFVNFVYIHKIFNSKKYDNNKIASCFRDEKSVKQIEEFVEKYNYLDSKSDKEYDNNKLADFVAMCIQ